VQKYFNRKLFSFWLLSKDKCWPCIITCRVMAAALATFTVQVPFSHCNTLYVIYDEPMSFHCSWIIKTWQKKTCLSKESESSKCVCVCVWEREAKVLEAEIMANSNGKRALTPQFSNDHFSSFWRIILITNKWGGQIKVDMRT